MKNKFFDVRCTIFAIDAISLCFLGLLVVLTVVFSAKVAGWQDLSLQLLAAAVLYTVAISQSNRLKQGWVLVLFRSVLVIGLYAYLFDAVDPLQHIVVSGWMDDALLSLEHFIIGTEAGIVLQEFVNPFVTEGMMFAYVIYSLLLPLVAFVCYWSHGMKGATDYLLDLAIGFVVCYVGFIVFPVASPLYYAPHTYSISLDGGLFAWCGEWIRQNQHYAGGSLPSPHCTAATIMLAMMYRHNRKFFFVALPTILTLYVSTVYGRYHYMWDGIVGIICASCVVKYSPYVVHGVQLVEAWAHRMVKGRVVLESAYVDALDGSRGR